MKKVRIGCASGGCAYERIEPAIELINKGEIDYIVFECIAERTMAGAHKEKLKDPEKGYNPMLEERMYRLLPLILDKNIKLISNMGVANTPAAIQKILAIAKELNLTNIKIAAIEGDDLLENIDAFSDEKLIDEQSFIRDKRPSIVSANAYLGSDPIAKALSNGANIVITGRVADVSLFTGITKYEFNWDATNYAYHGQAILLGHLMECAGQLTGGYFADPGYKDVPDLHMLGFPIAEIDEHANLMFTKTEGSGGTVNISTCKEQLLYEITDPQHYITPDGIVDFSNVRFIQAGNNKVIAQNAVLIDYPTTYKVNIGYLDGYISEAEISYGGSNSLNRAKLAADIVQKRLAYTNIKPTELRVDYIGFNALYKNKIAAQICSNEEFPEIRLRIAARCQTKAEAQSINREVDCLYINGPAGGSGIRTSIEEVLTIDNIIINKHSIEPTIKYFEN